jgi:DNA-binding MarR family transcriptional regulator
MSQASLRTAEIAARKIRVEETIPHLLKRLQHSFRKAVDEALRLQRIDMSLAHFGTLYMLADEPGVAGAELARRVFVTAQTMNMILRRLEKDGDIERRPFPGNARADSWFITKTGQTRLNLATQVAQGVRARMYSNLAPKDIEQLRGLLERCIAGLEPETEVIEGRRPKAAGAGKTRGR